MNSISLRSIVLIRSSCTFSLLWELWQFSSFKEFVHNIKTVVIMDKEYLSILFSYYVVIADVCNICNNVSSFISKWNFCLLSLPQPFYWFHQTTIGFIVFVYLYVLNITNFCSYFLLLFAWMFLLSFLVSLGKILALWFETFFIF